MHCTGNGKVLMLNFTEEQIDEYIELRGLKKYTEHTITDKETLMNELAEICEKGFARDREDADAALLISGEEHESGIWRNAFQKTIIAQDT